MPEFEREVNFVKGKKITDMKKGEIIYVQKLISGFNMTIECKFIKFEKGKVFAKPLRIESYDWVHLEDLYPDGILTARPDKCFLWGLRKLRQRINDHDYCCHWFTGGVVDE
jgi:hypothetical protein